MQVGPNQEVLRRPGVRAEEGVQALPEDGVPQGSDPGETNRAPELPTALPPTPN